MRSERATLAAFAGSIVIGGANFIAVKLSNEDLDPLFGAALRFTAAAAVLLMLARIRGTPLPRGRAAWGAAIYGLLAFGLAYALLYYALVGLAAGTTSVIVASVPLLTLALAVMHGQERFSGRGIVGGILAIVGIGILSMRALGGGVHPTYYVAALVGAVSSAEASVVAKSLGRPDPIATNGVGMAAGAMMLWLASLGFGETWALPAMARTWLVLAYLVALGSVALFVLFLYVMERWTASATVYALALMPVVAVALGAIVADESVTWELVVGGALVMAAVYVGALSADRTGAASAGGEPDVEIRPRGLGRVQEGEGTP